MAAAGASAPLGMGLYLSFSRAAWFACAAGLVALIVAAPRLEQAQSTGLSVIAGLLAAFAAAPFEAVTTLVAPRATRQRQGAIVLALLAIAVIAAGTMQAWLARREIRAL